ncbi:YbgC/YbaW family acyl-CoA thioester hydrolase [Lipingzhangella halophila]|uniref:YbgC/YbaW family acyl-CoA thioester hydrolase n=1 Tax=Lipingzhangella halophila TaxID=1783352 RepID=A0A7W7W3P0_9ACTN|nr:thioesterase family protein [Lipingzhangella halophila]MBB4933252.1 YbgC/YbaW family acyl-CoA thioester hydrolase [Lipingzhangella halophila]
MPAEAATDQRTSDGNGPGGARTHHHLAQVRFADLDPFNHVNNVRMLTYLEDARVSFLHWDSRVDGERRMHGLVVARHEVDYLRPLQMRREPVLVETWVTEVKHSSFTLAYEIRDSDSTPPTVYVRASSVLVGFDHRSQGIRRLNEEERAFLREYLHG